MYIIFDLFDLHYVSAVCDTEGMTKVFASLKDAQAEASELQSPLIINVFTRRSYPVKETD